MPRRIGGTPQLNCARLLCYNPATSGLEVVTSLARVAMATMTMRERMLAGLQGRPQDRVPFVQYSGTGGPNDEIWALLGRNRMGLLQWCGIHRVETPNCRFESEDFERDGQKMRRTTLHTPAGSLFEERAFESAYGSSSIRRHYVQEPRDYDVLIAYLRDGLVLPDYEGYLKIDRELGDDGFALPAIERTPYQQLWVQWTGLMNLSFHLAECPERVEEVIALLNARARKIFEIAYRSPAAFIDFPDNITAPTIGPERFRRYCVPLYNELAGMLAERGAYVFVHMDGYLKPLWDEIGKSGVRGIDSLSPVPDNDTAVGQARKMWPEMRLWVNFPSSCHLRDYRGVRAVAEQILEEDGRSGLLQIQISENVPKGAWRTSFPAIADAIDVMA